jgi:hypothetical protein
MTMTMTADPPGIRPAAVAGILLGDLIAPAARYYAARALGAPVIPALLLGGAIALPVALGGTAWYGRRPGLGIRRSLAELAPRGAGDAR